MPGMVISAKSLCLVFRISFTHLLELDDNLSRLIKSICVLLRFDGWYAVSVLVFSLTLTHCTMYGQAK